MAQDSTDGPRPLAPERLFRNCDPQSLGFETTDGLEPYDGIVGQPRALAAIEFGIGIERDGYNIFALGPSGTGKQSAVERYLEGKATSEPPPPDLCYVHNFHEPHRPRLLRLPAGRGRELRSAMDRLTEEVTAALQAALESEEFQTRRQVLEEELSERQNALFSQLGEEAASNGLALVRTPMGIVFAPLKGEEVLSPEEFQKLPEREQRRLEGEIERFKEKLQSLLRQMPRWQRETRDKLRRLGAEVSRVTVVPLVDELRERFADEASVRSHLDAVEKDMVENARKLVGKSEGEPSPSPLMAEPGGERPWLRRYRVNVLVDRSDSSGAPVVHEDNPTYHNLIGRVEHIPHMGAALTDFNLIKPGALHRANGGYLLIDALQLLRHSYAWEGLKRALRSKQIRIESLGEALSLISTYSLEPEPVALDAKLVLLGDPFVYYLLSGADPDFRELFKVAADFGTRLDWNPESQDLYARVLARLVKEEGLRPFGRDAIARVIEQSARDLGDSQKMSLLMSRVLDLLREADHWAARHQRPTVTAADVDRALEARIYRADRLREQLLEQMVRRTILVDTEGAQVGQVNGLAVYQMGDFTFARPSRITARARLGKGEVVDIEREVELSGPIHSKGVLILGGFLGARYAPRHPLSLSASLVFEQSYSGVDGDSASAAELFALLSAISGVPLRQSLAVTGSVNQRGEIQAIGAANEKIEGFFDLCKARGLSGDQGVLIPAANVAHLMLRREVVEAAAEGRFHVYPIATVDEGIELLTGRPAGERDDGGDYPEGSVNLLVERRLIDLAEAARAFSGPRESAAGDEDGDGGPPAAAPEARRR